MILDGANLYGASHEGWSIVEIRCSHIYLDGGAALTPPTKRDFMPGEFEREYGSAAVLGGDSSPDGEECAR